MPELSDPRREKFAALVAQGVARADAFAQCGFKARSRKVARVGASRIGKELAVVQRIAELEQRRGALEGDQRQRVLDKLWANLAAASQARQYAAANRSLELLGRQLGLFKDVVQFESADAAIAGKTDDELQRYVRDLILDMALAPVAMDEDELRKFIEINAPRVGLRVVEAADENGADAESPATH